eukprot:TRINITY_DN11094_c0_g1_i1.p1 TRINITY_DN11094_c0_g1~~TRINITY_DN11094_c0_g1_i1.p1  ORF type:complete len:380 (+),score=76.10 TRINITY_DN11094_c0_g1_i1:749-1888(+)
MMMDATTPDVRLLFLELERTRKELGQVLRQRDQFYIDLQEQNSLVDFLKEEVERWEKSAHEYQCQLGQCEAQRLSLEYDLAKMRVDMKTRDDTSTTEMNLLRQEIIGLNEEVEHLRRRQEEEARRRVSTPPPSPPPPPYREEDSEEEDSEEEEEEGEQCGICLDRATPDMFVSISECNHRFCSNCVRQHARSKLTGDVGAVRCPEHQCSTELTERHLRVVFAGELEMQDMVNLLSHRKTMEALRANTLFGRCPMAGCQGMFLLEDITDEHPNVECPACNRMSCSRCKVPWSNHAEFTCAQYQALPDSERQPEDRAFRRMIVERGWRICKCGAPIEKTEGCNHMTCVCGRHFCYMDGAELDPKNLPAHYSPAHPIYILAS